MTEYSKLIVQLRSNADAHHESPGTERRRAADALEQLQSERDAALAVIEQMRAIVADPVSDYYGEIRVQFDAIAKAPASALAKVKADARREALEEAATIAERLTEGWHPSQTMPIAVSRNIALLIRRAAHTEAARIEKEATGG